MGINTRAILARAANNSPLYAAMKAKSARPLWNAFGNAMPNAQNGFVPAMGRAQSMQSMQKYVSPKAIKEGSDAFLRYAAKGEAELRRKNMVEIARRRAQEAADRAARARRIEFNQTTGPKFGRNQELLRTFLSLINR